MTYFDKFVEFIRKHKLYQRDSLAFISERTTYLDYENINERDFIGCYYDVDKFGRVVDFKVYVPKIADEKTLLINIHEYVHAFILYKLLNKNYDIGLEKEVLPLMYEKICILENEEFSLKKYERVMKEVINEINTDEYIIGNEIANVLVPLEDGNLEELNKEAKRLVKVYTEK